MRQISAERPPFFHDAERPSITASSASTRVGVGFSVMRGVDALLDLAAVVQRPLACGGKSHHRERSQTEVGGAAVDAEPLNPDPRQPAVGHAPDPKSESVAAAAVAVDAGVVDLFDEGRGQWQTGPRVRFSHSLVSLSLSRMSLDGKIRHATG